MFINEKGIFKAGLNVLIVICNKITKGKNGLKVNNSINLKLI